MLSGFTDPISPAGVSLLVERDSGAAHPAPLQYATIDVGVRLRRVATSGATVRRNRILAKGRSKAVINHDHKSDVGTASEDNQRSISLDPYSRSSSLSMTTRFIKAKAEFAAARRYWSYVNNTDLNRRSRQLKDVA
ncbi:hypothetical protein ABKN59_006991 [Abortiporus biennis]